MNILEIIGVVGLFIIFATFVLWAIPLYKKLRVIQDAIRAKNDELDAVETSVNGRVTGALVTEKQRLAQIENMRKPILRQLERLEQERQFVVDKLPFFKK